MSRATIDMAVFGALLIGLLQLSLYAKQYANPSLRCFRKFYDYL